MHACLPAACVREKEGADANLIGRHLLPSSFEVKSAGKCGAVQYRNQMELMASAILQYEVAMTSRVTVRSPANPTSGTPLKIFRA